MQNYNTQYGGQEGYEQKGVDNHGFSSSVAPVPPKDSDAQAQESRTTRCTHQCHHSLFWTFAMIALCGVCMLIGFGVAFADPYYKALTYVEANCTVNFANLTEGKKGCSCGKNCGSSFPCSKIEVTLIDVPGSIANTQLARKHSGLGSACSVHPTCDSSKSKNYDRVVDILQDYPVNSTIECFYNPDDKTKIFELMGFNELQIIMFLVGPAIAIVISCVLITLVYLDARNFKKIIVGPKNCC